MLLGLETEISRLIDSPSEETHTPLTERDIERNYLGQFIPLHYHHNMLMDENRMRGFRSAIEYAVAAGDRVLELGGGTGVMSCFAAAKADKVWCVEFNPDMVAESRRLLALNPHGHKVEVVHANAFHYLPPEPVDVVICEMIHVAMLREKQVEMIESFKMRYLRRFGGPLPRFIPEAVVMAVQPLEQAYEFFGFYAPIIQFQRPDEHQAKTKELATPAVYSMLDFTQEASCEISWSGAFTLEKDGVINALRFVTKNILAVVPERSTSINWLNDYLVLPIAEPMAGKAGDTLEISFQYRTGASLQSLEKNIRVALVKAGVRQMDNAPPMRLAPSHGIAAQAAL